MYEKYGVSPDWETLDGYFRTLARRGTDVAVNGVLVVDGGRLTGKTPGRALRGPGWKSPESQSRIWGYLELGT
jgi:hypothetical protein